MPPIFLGLAVLVGLAVFAGGLLSGRPIVLPALLRRSGGAALMALAVAMLATGRLLPAAATFVVALMLLGEAAGGFARLVRPFLGRWGQLPAGGERRRSRSRLRSAALEMDFDGREGVLSGRVLAGRYAGRELAHLSVADLFALREEIAADLPGLSLLEAYLDRRVPLWRQHTEQDPAARQRGSAGAGPMTDDEAHQILGLLPGATETEVRSAHRRLMKAVHPDRGGSTFLAARINEAKDRLIGRHRRASDH